MLLQPESETAGTMAPRSISPAEPGSVTNAPLTRNMPCEMKSLSSVLLFTILPVSSTFSIVETEKHANSQRLHSTRLAFSLGSSYLRLRPLVKAANPQRRVDQIVKSAKMTFEKTLGLLPEPENGIKPLFFSVVCNIFFLSLVPAAAFASPEAGKTAERGALIFQNRCSQCHAGVRIAMALNYRAMQLPGFRIP